MSQAAAALSSIQTLQAALTIIQSLGLTSWQFPANCEITNSSSYDFIVVGGGTAGSVLANRLSANENITVLLIESGAYAPFESELPGLFTVLPSSAYDYNFTSVDDKYTAQNLQNSRVELTQGKMLGGSSANNHMIHVHGDPNDFNQWANILSDDTWTYENVLPYFKKQEQLTDSDLLATHYAQLHGTDGMVKITRQKNSVNTKYLAAFKELGHNIVDDVTSKTSTLGYSEPLFTIGDGIRQSAAVAYLGAEKSRSNMCVVMSTTATKILFEEGAAAGVQVTTASGETYVLYAKKEVVVAAGAINSPKLLMLSGIGPKSHLESLGIEVVADLPVGQNFMDHPSAVLVYQMETNTDAAAASNPHKFPVPTTTGYVALNSSQLHPDYQVINLVFPPNSAAQLQLCANVFKYSNTICDKFFKATNGRNTLFVVHNLMMPESRGEVLLSSADPATDPLIYTGIYKSDADLTLMSQSLEHFNKVLDTAYFKSVNATRVDLDICSDLTGSEFWQCYALGMSATMWHYAGTCAMGSVVDSSLRVKGVDKLRVVDASAMPTEVSGNINAAVGMIAERAADLILNTWNTSV